MKPDLQRRIQRYGWDKAAPYYDTSWQKQLWPAQKKLLKKTKIEPGDSVLDISCGTGLVTQPIAQAVGRNGSVTGVDLSEGMIREARQRADECNLENISFQQMDAEQLDFESNHFDTVICSLGLMYFPNPEKALEEMTRVARPGGKVSALVWGARSECGWASIFPIVDRRVKSEVCPLFFQLGTGKALQKTFKSVGVRDPTVDRFSFNLHFKNEDACMAAFLGGAVALAYQKFDDEIRDEVHAEYLKSIQKFKNGKAYEIPGEFVIVLGKNPACYLNQS